MESRDNSNSSSMDNKRPMLSDLRESGAIEQDADMVIFVHRPEYYKIYQDEQGRNLRGMAQIIIAKHRKGATKDVLLTFRGEFTRFENPEDSGAGYVMDSKMNSPSPLAGPISDDGVGDFGAPPISPIDVDTSVPF